jgi:hypothetical protein
MPLGMGYSVEGQVTGKEEFGGLQLLVVPAKEGRIPKVMPGILRGFGYPGSYGPPGVYSHTLTGASYGASYNNSGGPQLESYGSSNIHDGYATMDMMSMDDAPVACAAAAGGEEKTSGGFTKSANSVYVAQSLPKAAEMGLGMGGEMVQKIYPDPHGIDCWDQEKAGKLFVHIVNSQMYEQITGEKPPASPITAATYSQHGYQWYKIYDEGMGDVPKSETLGKVKTTGQMDVQKGFAGQQDDTPVKETNVVGAGWVGTKPGSVRTGSW